MSCRWLCVIFLALIYAENDVEGSRDHPLVSRYNGSVIRKHSESEFETYQLRIGSVESFIKPAGETKNVEGRLTRINYLAPEEDLLPRFSETIKKLFWTLVWKKSGSARIVVVVRELLKQC